jgi:predicted DNA-binding antitoxin AbrB/MazE fold protein
MTKVTAIFEHGVFRPIEPVRVDDGSQVVLSFEESHPVQAGEVVVSVGSLGLPVITPPHGSRPITNEDVARGLEEP